MDRLKEAVSVFTSCIENNPFFQDGIIARGNVYMDYGSKGGLIYARFVLLRTDINSSKWCDLVEYDLCIIVVYGSLRERGNAVVIIDTIRNFIS